MRCGRDGRPDGHATIGHDTCGALADYASGDHAHPGLDQVIAVHVLAHEAEHLAGVEAEAEAECRSVQRTSWVAERLGASPAQARHLALRYAIEVFPDMPPAHRAPGCRDGGPMDLAPAERGWPTAGGVVVDAHDCSVSEVRRCPR